MADQNRATLDWEDVRVFVALARHGSLSGAARALAINHGTVSRRILSLEAAIGEKLVERRPDGYMLTPAGTRVLAAASDMEAAADVLARGGADDRPKGLVRVNAPPSISQGFLVERLAKLTILAWISMSPRMSGQSAWNGVKRISRCDMPNHKMAM